MKLMDDGNRWLAVKGFSVVMLSSNFGTFLLRTYGSKDVKRFDVIGQTVNSAAHLQTKGFGISPEAFRKLASTTRNLFKKHASPVIYIPITQRH